MLQKSSVDHYVVRSMFDKLIENFPDMEQYLGANATITTDPLFERAVVKTIIRESCCEDPKPTGEYSDCCRI